MFLLLMLFGSLCAYNSVEFLDRKNQVIDILYQLTGNVGPYSSALLKSYRGIPKVYQFTCDNKHYVARFLDYDTQEGSCREIAIQHEAAKHGWGPSIMYSNPESNVIIMELLQSPLQWKDQYNNDAFINHFVNCMHTIHATTDIVIGTRVSFVKQIANRLERALCNKSWFIDHFQLNSLQGMLTFFQGCIDKTTKPVFVHGDLHNGNMFFVDDKYVCIDFEACKYDNPYVDLAHIAVCYGLDRSNEIKLLSQYWGRQITDNDYAQFLIFKLFVLVKFGCYCLEGFDFKKGNLGHMQEDFYIPHITLFAKNFVVPDGIDGQYWYFAWGISLLREIGAVVKQLQTFFIAPIVLQELVIE